MYYSLSNSKLFLFSTLSFLIQLRFDLSRLSSAIFRSNLLSIGFSYDFVLKPFCNLSFKTSTSFCNYDISPRSTFSLFFTADTCFLNSCSLALLLCKSALNFLKSLSNHCVHSANPLSLFSSLISLWQICFRVFTLAKHS